MNDVRIRSEEPGDEAAIGLLTSAAFAGAKHSSGTEARIVEALRQAGALTLSLLAMEHGALVGHVAFSPVFVAGTSQGWFGLGPLSVAPDRQRKGIGSRLVQEGLRLLQQKAAAGCVVLGDPRYYARFGFACDPGLTFEGAPAEYFMSIAFRQPVPAGPVGYHEAFFVS